MGWARAPTAALLVIDMDATIGHPGRQGRPRRTLRSPPVVGRRPATAARSSPGCQRPGNAGRIPQRTTWSSWARPSRARAVGGRSPPGDHPDDTAKELVVRAPTPVAPPTGWPRMPGPQHRVQPRLRHRRPRPRRCVPHPDDHWRPAVEPDGTARDGAEVVELTDLVDLSAWPKGPAHRPSATPPSRRPAHLVRHHQGCATPRSSATTTTTPPRSSCSNANKPGAENVIPTPKPVGSQNLLRRRRQQRRCGCSCASPPTTCSSGPRRSASLDTAAGHPNLLRHRLPTHRRPHHPTNQRLDLDRTWPWTTTLLDALHRLPSRLSPLTVSGWPPSSRPMKIVDGCRVRGYCPRVRRVGAKGTRRRSAGRAGRAGAREG